MYVPDSQQCSVPNSQSPWTVNSPGNGVNVPPSVTTAAGATPITQATMQQTVQKAQNAFLASNVRTPSDFAKFLDIPPVKTNIEPQMDTWDSASAMNAVCQEAPDITSEVHTAVTPAPTTVDPWCGLNKVPIGKYGAIWKKPSQQTPMIGWLGLGLLAVGAYVLLGDSR